MNIFNKYEAFGIFLSIAIMAIALAGIRFKGDVFAQNATNTNQQAGVISASNEEEKNDIEQTLLDASSSSGKLIKLVVDDVRVGSGEEVQVGDTVTVHYTGTTQDGVRFDSSHDRGTPFTFMVGEGKVIQGWEKGLLGMKVGGERILVIPAEMAYGNRQVGLIPPNSPLVFIVELLEIE